MYNQLKNDFIMELDKRINLDNDQLEIILDSLDYVAFNYEVQRKQTQIVLYNNELPQLAKIYIVSKSVEGYSKDTLYNYTRMLTKFFFTIQKSPEQVTTNDIRVYLYMYQQERNISNRSLDKIRDTISGFYKWMYVEGYIDKNPTLAIKNIKYEKKPKEACTQIELEYLRKSCVTLKQKAILEILYSTGCRVGELVILKKEDINWDNKTIHLFGKGKKHRISFINAKAEVALKEYLASRKDDREWLFVSDRYPYNQMHTDGIQKIIRQICERAGDKVQKNVTPHILRHTMATRIVENNSDLVSVQKILGHSNINTTMTYIHSTLDNAKTQHANSIV